MSSLRYRGAGTLLAIALVLAWEAPARAQYVVGESLRPEVEVDTNVLEGLGREPTLPELLLGDKPAQQRLAVTEPPDAPPAAVAAELRPLHPVTLHRPVHKGLHKQAHKASTRAKASAVAKAHPAKVKATKVASVTAPVKPTVEALPPVAQEAPKAPPVAEPVKADASLPQVTLPVIVPKDDEKKPDTEVVATPPAAEVSAATPPAAEPKPAAAVVVAASDAPAQVTPAVATPVQSASSTTVTPVQALSAPLSTTAPMALTEASATAPASAELAQTHGTAASSSAVDAPLMIPFEKEAARLPDDEHTPLNQLADRLAGDANLQVQLLAYAEGDDDDASKARRLSLSRALAVRSYLIDQGVRAARIEVRALGNKVPDGAADRVDVVIQKR